MLSYTGFDMTGRKPMSDLQVIADRVESTAKPTYTSRLQAAVGHRHLSRDVHVGPGLHRGYAHVRVPTRFVVLDGFGALEPVTVPADEARIRG
jgi:hypothetical protein